MFLVLFLAVPSQLVRLVPILQQETKSNQPTDADRLSKKTQRADPGPLSLQFMLLSTTDTLGIMSKTLRELQQ